MTIYDLPEWTMYCLKVGFKDTGELADICFLPLNHTGPCRPTSPEVISGIAAVRRNEWIDEQRRLLG